MRTSFALLAIALFAPACSGSASTADLGANADSSTADLSLSATTDAATTSDLPPPSGDLSQTGDLGTKGLIAARPYASKVPAKYDPKVPTPLLILLHGYTASGALQDSYFGLSGIVDAKGFLYAYPDGTVDQSGKRFWEGTDACCDFFHTGVDDVAYLNAIIDDMSAHYNVDPKRIFLVGHSNGGFMAHRMACDKASRIAAIVALAGDNWNDPAKCQPSEAVAVLQVHGDADTTISYNGGQLVGVTYPAAHDSVGTWVTSNGCGAMPTVGAPLDIDSVLPGNETMVARYTGCKPGGAAELWTIHGGGHVPSLQKSWPGMIYDWLAAHPKP